MWVSIFRHLTDKRVRQHEMAWSELTDMLSIHEVRTERDGPLWSPVQYKPSATRGKNGVKTVYCAVGDMEGPDVPPPDKMALSLRNLGVPFVLHSTWSHMQDKHGYTGPAYRVVVELTTPVSAEDWPAIWPRLDHMLFWGLSDPQTKDCSRIFYLPACPPGSAPLVLTGDGGEYRNDSVTEYGDVEGMREYAKSLASSCKIAPERIAKIDSLEPEQLVSSILSLERRVNGN